MRLYPGNGGLPCGTYMSPLFRGPHPTCNKCRGRTCSYDTTCYICNGWSVDQWEHYRHKCAYAERSKSSSRHAGDPIETASNPPLSPTSTSSVSPLPPSLPLPPPSEGSGEGSEAPSVSNIVNVNVNEPSVSPPTSMPSREHGEGGGGRDTLKVGNGEREAASTSLASAGVREEPLRPQPDPLDEKLHSSPIKFRPNLPSAHHVDDWGENGEYRPPSPTSPQPRTKRKREKREQAIDQARAADFYEKSARRRSPHRARPRPPLGARPPAVFPHAGAARRGFTHTLGPNPSLQCAHRVRQTCGSSAERRNPPQLCRRFDLAANWSPQSLSPYPRPHQRRDSADRPRYWAPQSRMPKIQPSPSDPHHRATQPPGHTDPLDYSAAQHALDHPNRDRPYEAQRPQVPSAAPLSGHSREYPPSEDYRRRSTPPPARSRSPPTHAISDSDESDTETRPRWTYSPPRKAPRQDDDAFIGHHRHGADEYPDPPHGPYKSKQASADSPEPEPSTSRDQPYAWPPAPRDFDNDSAESVASNEDEPDFSFSAVVDMIRNFHDVERPPATAPARTTTAFDQMRGVQSDGGPAFKLPTSPLLGGLIDNANSALARLIREQSNGFLPFPMKRHWQFYRTASTSLSAPYVVSPSLASLTREKPGDNKRRLVSLSHTVLAGLESALASIGETAS